MNTTTLRDNAKAAALAAWPIYGATVPTGQYGITTTGEVAPVLSTLRDGTDLAAVWTEFSEVLDIWNKDRRKLTDLLAFRTVNAGEAVPQNITPALFEQATEIGVPQAAGTPGDSLMLGYQFTDYDIATRLTRLFLRGADVRQVRAIMDNILTGDTTLTTGEILKSIFGKTRRKNPEGFTVYDLYDGVAPGPPPYLGRQFPTEETHYITSATEQVDAGDAEHLIRLVTRKGFSKETGATLLLLCNPDEAEHVMSWRANQPSRPPEGAETIDDVPVARWDFVPSESQPPYLSGDGGELIGEPVPGSFHDIPVLGSYGEALVIQSDYVPSGYIAAVATYGPNSDRNVVGFREWPDASQQGLRLMPGNWSGVPLVESFATRGFGTGVRRRGGAAVCQITTEPAYTAPAFITHR
ncbi:hypothetical protein [Mycolicibacterium elephantis]|uniref:Uncharacterized protein n=3 Tax=Mycobacteriaceae TaxID=1762 RepID=A0A1A3C3X1_MYCAS|nr:hypothetical protein [Mycolicibacterium elephantis]MCV7222951.1 hypothetical protein [Mycolicibacterium elephantis]OBI81820.1 hypothetical protein A9X01_23040 [Mycobacterium asiaticum]RWA22331.1 hypothetical protein MELE44368_13030 [Mycolicibacterium elephantis DSM 44368]